MCFESDTYECDKFEQPHIIEIDEKSQRANFKLLELIKNGDDLYLAHNKDFENFDHSKFNIYHWFIKSGPFYIEFGDPVLNMKTVRVNINTLNREFDKVNAIKVEMNDNIRERIKHVLGMQNYSICFRNCEHVAKFIIYGEWVTSGDYESLKQYFIYRKFYNRPTAPISLFSNINKYFFSSFSSSFRLLQFLGTDIFNYQKKFFEKNFNIMPTN